MKKPINDPFETVAWSLYAQKTPEEVLSDIFSNDSIAYFKTSIQVAYSSAMQNKTVKKFQNKELFRAYLRINSLILVGAYLYKRNKKKIRKTESEIENTTWLDNENTQHNEFSPFYSDPLYHIYGLFEMNTISYWKAEWAYFIVAAMRKRKFDDSENYPSLKYFIHTLIDALYEVHQSS